MNLIKEALSTPSLLKEIYGDLAKPGVQQAGKALGTVIGLGNTALWPILILNEKTRMTLEKNLEDYREKLKNTPEEEINGVAPEVGVPIVEKLTHVTNDELKNMYIALLSKASVSTQSNLAHPAFVNIINNLSPDEAKLVKSIRASLGVPYIEVRLQYKKKEGWTTLNSMIPALPCADELQYPENIHAYISNLEGLGLLKTRADVCLTDDSLYVEIEESALDKYSGTEDVMPGRQLNLTRGKLEITPFAHMFMDACFY